MNLKDIEIKDQYRSNNCSDLGTLFVSKLLEQSTIYKRAVGFFSSSALVNISRGISYLAQRKGAHICFVVSPILYKEDVEAIKQGYKNKEKVVEEAMLRQFEEPKDNFGCERLNFLCHLIENGVLDIKVADRLNDYSENELGIYHEKIGLFIDDDNNKVAFSGSLNESQNAFSSNFESVLVFKSWEETKRVSMIEDDFNDLWENKTNTLEVYDFPEAVKNALFHYKKASFHSDIDEYEKKERANQLIADTRPRYRCKFQLYEYQKNAINKWAHQNYRGLFDMGTGTGKTVTALTATVSLLKRLDFKLATIIVCPFTHLVEQWVEEEENFNIDFIVGYSDHKYANYIGRLSQAIQDFNDGIRPYFFFITTNASYKTKKIQNILKQIKGNVLFIADEVHNFGSEGLQASLIGSFQFRIGLSATIDRHRDDIGTQAIYSYFGEPVIHYGLKEAIQNGVLTHYFYYPIVVSLTDNEIKEYQELTEKIRKNSYPDKNGGVALTKSGELYALKRARLISSASNKIDALKTAIKDHTDEYNMLIYCGTGKVNDDIDGAEERQIDDVCKILGNQFGMRIARYTSRESTEERKIIAGRFKSGNDLQALVAIKCLDEGVNIPSIKTAFILASSTNPREYIQRRGRVLRKFPGKTYSYIYDFVTLPVLLEDSNEYGDDFLKSFKTLAKNETDRIKEFSSLADNEHESDMLINETTNVYGLNYFEKVEDFEKINWEEINYGE